MDYQSIIEKGLKLGITEIELYVRNARGMVIKLFHGEVESSQISNDGGISIRGLYNGQIGYAMSEDFSEEAIDYALKKLIDNAQTTNAKEIDIIFEGVEEYPVVSNERANYDDYSTPEKVELLKNLEKSLLNADPKIRDVGYCQYSEREVDVKIINSKGLNLSDSYSYIHLFSGVVAAEQDETAAGYSYDIKTKFKDLETERIIKEATEDALGELGGKPIPSGVYPVVLRNDVFSEILEAFSSVFSGESAMRNMTQLKDRLGEKVFGDNINIVDNPFYEESLIKRSFDDEGYPCEETTLVENGVFKSFLHNLKTARYHQTKSTGNGFKAGLTSPIGVSPTNLYLKPGNQSLDEMIAGVEKGLFITKCAGLHSGLNPISGSFNLQATGYLIENGKKTQPVTLIVVSGNFFEMLNEVEIVGNDLIKNLMGVGAPSIKVKSLMVSGK
jgi:PmbA protein